MMCRPLCVDHVAPAAERFGADSEIADAKKPFIPGSDFKTTIRAHMTGGRGKIWRGFGNYGREEALFTRWFRPEMEDHTRKSIKEGRRSAPAFPQRRQKFTH